MVLALVAEVWDGLSLDTIGVFAGFGAAVSLATYFLLGEHSVGSDPPLHVLTEAFVVATIFWNCIRPVTTLADLDLDLHPDLRRQSRRLRCAALGADRLADAARHRRAVSRRAQRLASPHRDRGDIGRHDRAGRREHSRLVVVQREPSPQQVLGVVVVLMGSGSPRRLGAADVGLSVTQDDLGFTAAARRRRRALT